jgi:hypothetical protein
MEREHELPRARIAMRPESARSGFFNSMTEKVLQEYRKRQAV